MIEEHSIAMVRPKWNHREYFLNQWREKDVTVLICQRKTKDLIQLCVESVLRFYPDIPILIVDGESNDDSTLYCKWMELTNPNIRVWERKNTTGKHSSHGDTMHEAITKYVDTKYVLIMDSDTIMDRGGCVEGMIEQMQQNQNIFATGTLMLVSKSNEAVGEPKDENDVLRYSHPSCSIMRVDIYNRINAPFCNHGSPSHFTMRVAQEFGYEVAYYPIHLYVSHLSGSSWCEPRTIWNHDHNVFIRPFITFINNGVSAPLIGSLNTLKDKDYDIVTRSTNGQAYHVIHHGESVGGENKEYHCSGSLYEIRFNVIGEYICDLKDASVLSQDLVTLAKEKVVFLRAPDEFQLHGLTFTKRQLWQIKDCFNG